MSKLAYDDYPPSTRAIVRAVMAIDEAKAAVRPYVGEIDKPCDSSDAVYLRALSLLGHNTTELAQHPGTATAVWPVLKRSRPAPFKRNLAVDARIDAKRLEQFPNWNRLGRSGY